MSKTNQEQFDEAMSCITTTEAQAWLEAEIVRYEKEFGQPAEVARRVILANLGYMAGYYDAAVAKKVANLFGAVHPIFGTADYHNTVTAEQALEAGYNAAKDTV